MRNFEFHDAMRVDDDYSNEHRASIDRTFVQILYVSIYQMNDQKIRIFFEKKI